MDTVDERKARNLANLKLGREKAQQKRTQRALESIRNPGGGNMRVESSDASQPARVADLTTSEAREEGGEASPIHSIRKFCLQCVGTHAEVAVCCAYVCPLWDYRFGKLPKTVNRDKPGMLNRDHVRKINAEKAGKR